MNFTRHFEFHVIPEWSEYYLDYKGLNHLLETLSNQLY